MKELFISPTKIADLKDDYVIIDTRKPEEFLQSHIKGAVTLPIDYWLKENNEKGIARGERIVTELHFASIMAYLGIDNRKKLVVYDDNSGRGSARFWFVSNYYGHSNVSILDGGWKNYTNMNLPTESGENSSRFAYFNPTVTTGYIYGLDELLVNFQNVKLVDARSDAEWKGLDLHNNPRGGHLPGSVHLNWELLVSDNPERTFANVDFIREQADSLGLSFNDHIVTYCQAGVRASFVALALRYAGFSNCQIYDGSMYEWSRKNALSLNEGGN